MSEGKEERATEQRKRKAKESGDVPVSREFTSAAVLLGCLMILGPSSTRFLALWRQGMDLALLSAPRAFATPEDLIHSCVAPFGPALVPVGMVLLTALAIAVGIGAAQTGGIEVHPETIGWKWSRLSPASHLSSLFGTRTAVRFAKSLLPAAALIWIAVRTLKQQMYATPFLTPYRLPSALFACYSVAMTAGWIALGWSGLDYAVERRNWAQKLRMSKQDIRDEAKESNGNPHTKGRIRQVQRAMRRRRVKADVAAATVVITNPTHYAVALSFDMGTMAAPRVLCKGRDLHAATIREEARWAGVPIVENPPLARSLYRLVDEGQPIPFELYTTVASILAFLLRRETRSDARPGAQPGASSATRYDAPPAPHPATIEAVSAAKETP